MNPKNPNLAGGSQREIANLMECRHSMLNRLSQMLEREVLSLGGVELSRLAGVDDTAALAELAVRKLTASPLKSDRRTRMEIEGIQRFNAMIEASGGYYSTEQVATLTGKTPNAIRKDVGRKKLLQFKRAGESSFPVFQFKDGDVLTGIPAVLSALPEHITPMGAARFFLSPNDVGGGVLRSPVDLLRSGVSTDMIVSLAKEYQKQLSA